ncbi:MAG: TonB family protein [Proteobacteria bacterium]|nr:TonB family protein [Pseudomonadota bacterium]
MIATVLLALAKANIAAAAPILCVVALRKWARGTLGARAAYGLWLAPLLAAAAVLLPHPALQAAPGAIAPIVLQAESAADAFVAEAVTVTPDQGPDLAALLAGGWIAGGLAAAGLLARRQARFVASLGRLTPLPQPRLYRAERAGVGPAVVGVIRPKVVAPADFETRFAADERALILAHEAQHLSAHDAAINALACALQCLCWFNPLVHLAARLMRVDQELACDAAVVGRFPEQRRAYAELLLKTQLFAQPLPLGCHWPAGAEHPLKARIAMLKSPLPARAARRLGAAVTLAACAGAAGLAWAASPATAEPPDRKVESQVSAGDVRVERRTTGTAQASMAGSPHQVPISEPRRAPVGFAQPASDRRIATNPIWLEKRDGDDIARPQVDVGPAPARLLAAFQTHAPVITKPDWVEKPVAADVTDFYPKAALAAHTEAWTTMHCAVAITGQLTDCKVTREEPQGLGFGEAALALAAKFRMKPQTQDGVPTAGGEINIPIRFLLPSDHPASPPATPHDPS